MNLLTDEQKAIYGRAIMDLHDTFARKIMVYKTPERTVLSTTPSYNFIYNDQQEGENVTYVPVSGEIDVRIKWLSPQELKGLADIKEEIHGNIVRIKIKKEDMHWIEDWKHIEIDGRAVQFFGTSKPHGLFTVDYYTVYLEESN